MMKLTGDRNQCPSCMEYFNSTSSFEKHRVGVYSPNTRRCLLTPEMTFKGMAKNTSGFWVGKLRPANAPWRESAVA